MKTVDFLLGVDNGGTQCLGRLANLAGKTLSQGVAGLANIRLGLEVSLVAVLDAALQCRTSAGLGDAAFARTSACLALAGATGPHELAAAQEVELPFRHWVVTDRRPCRLHRRASRPGQGRRDRRHRQHRLGGGWRAPLPCRRLGPTPWRRGQRHLVRPRGDAASAPRL